MALRHWETHGKTPSFFPGIGQWSHVSFNTEQRISATVPTSPCIELAGERYVPPFKKNSGRMQM